VIKVGREGKAHGFPDAGPVYSYAPGQPSPFSVHEVFAGRENIEKPCVLKYEAVYFNSFKASFCFCESFFGVMSFTRTY
jgi:hypothetical protein